MVSIDPIFYNYDQNHYYFPTRRNTSNNTKGNKKMAKAASFKVVVKDGHTEYKFDVKSGTNKSKTVDYVEEFTDFASALSEFLIYVTDEYNEDKVSLTFVPAKKK